MNVCNREDFTQFGIDGLNLKIFYALIYSIESSKDHKRQRKKIIKDKAISLSKLGGEINQCYVMVNAIDSTMKDKEEMLGRE